ncbi:MAG: SpvB/TcaC N-terminal domain-containing protein [Arenimonas sp.]
MFKRMFWLSAVLAVSAFAGQIVIKSGVLARQDVSIVGESTWDKLANATSQTSQELWNSAKSFVKSASFLLPDAIIQSLSSELPTHDATVGSTPGQAGVSGGSASYSIPIALPPGRKGMQPSISLSYSSRGGNGIAGMGWNISGLSSIHRCPQTLEQDGQIRAVDYSANDRLCLDGQRLVATSGTYGSINTKYATEIDSFTRITQLGGALTGANSYFKVEYKSGEIAYFGSSTVAANEARVIPGGVTKPLNWLIARSEDRLGNNIVYTYTNFGDGEVQPATIFYTGFNTVQGDRKVEFVYETRPSTSGANDQSSSYLAGGLTRQTKRLTTIKTWVASEAVREYRLNYGATVSATSGRSLLRSVQECAMLSGAATCRRPISFAWTEGAIQHQLRLENTVAAWGNGKIAPIGDLDGDGAKDYSWMNYDFTAPVKSRIFSLGTDHLLKWSFDTSSMSLTTLMGYDEAETDFDMDGRTDLSTLVNGQLVVYFWRGDQISPNFFDNFNVSWNTGIYPAIGLNADPYLVQDMDGDGRADVVVTEIPTTRTASCYLKVRVLKNNVGALPGSSGGFTEMSNTCLTGTFNTDNTGNGFWTGEKLGRSDDFNGDGLPDIWLDANVNSAFTPISAYGPSRLLLASRAPNYAVTPISFSALFPSTETMTLEEGQISTIRRWIDVNGDGLKDYVYARKNPIVNGNTPSGSWTIRLNRGGIFSNRILLTSSLGLDGPPIPSGTNTPWSAWRAGRFSQSDSDSDGREEILIPRSFAVRICTKHFAEGGGGSLPFIVAGPDDGSSLLVGGGDDGTGNVSAMGGPANEDFMGCPNIGTELYLGEEQTPDQPAYLGQTAPAGQSWDRNADGTVNAADGLLTYGIRDMYTNEYGGADQSLYYLSALRFIETGPNQYSVNEIPTGQISGSHPVDLFGDGAEDGVLRFDCRYSNPSQCKMVIADKNGNVVPGATGYWPNGDAIKNSGQFYVNENRGPGGILNGDNLTPKTPDMMTSVTDGIGNITTWSYYPLSSKAGRNQPGDTPLYTLPTDPALRYVDARHIYFGSSMQVVSEMTQSNGIGANVNKTRYGYSEAMYNTQGRGFQGFRKIIEEDMTGGLRTTTIFSQKYPLTSMVEQVVVNPITRVGETGPISRTTNKWRCNRLDRNDTAACNVTPGTNPVRFVYQSYSQNVTFDLNTSLAGLPDKLTGYTADYNHDTTACDGGTIAVAAGMDAYGNVTAKTHFVSDFSDGTPGYKNYIALSCNRTRNTFATADTTNWWLDKLTNTETRNEILHGVDQPLPSGASNPVYATNTAYTWNTNRTLASETFQNGIANQQKLTAYTYPTSNNYGLPLSVTVTASGDQNAGGRTTSTTYSADGYFPLSITNALGHTATTVVRLRDGLPISVTDPNGLRTLTTYDAFSQATLVKARGTLDSQYLAPDKQVAATWCTVTNNINSCGLSDAAYQLTSVQDGSPTSVSTHDKLGRVLRTQSKLLDGTNSYSDTQYNNKGQTIAQSLPYRNGDTPLWTYFVSYDITGRLTAKSTPQQHAIRGDMVTTYTYTGRTTQIQVCGGLDLNTSNCLNLSRTTDSTGRYVETSDALNGVTKFWFDANGQAAVLQDVLGSQIKATYNAIGQRVSVNDPNQGISNFTYNALGEVLTQTDARGITSTTTYDKLGRKTQFSVTADENGDGVNDAIIDTWTYDPTGAKGQLSQSKRSINDVTERQESSSFDALIRPMTLTTLQNTGGGTSRTYINDLQYDSYYGRLVAQFQPNGEGEQFIYNQYGYGTEERNASNASTYRQTVTVDSAGRPTRELKGFNLATDTAYWPNGQTKQITHQKDGVTIRKIHYAYDVFGNVATQELNQGMANATLESFQYDALHRLTQSQRTGQANTTVNYGYDAAGNFTFKSDFSTATATSYKLATGGLGGGGANAVKSVTLIGGGTRSYGYDASGNMTADNAGFAAKYDHANLATKLQRGAVINYFVYGPNNAKARQTGSDGSKVYVGGYEDWITANQTKVSLGNYAQVTNGTGGRQLNYFLTDRLGSVDAVTDGNGNLIETRGYDAFGAPRTGVWGDATQIASTAITPKGFTSHEHLNSVKLIHMNGRMYDYQLGRFLGVDPFIQMPTNSQSLNPYSYIMNNPLSGTDPTGYTTECVDAACPETAPAPAKEEVKTTTKTTRESVTGSHIKREVTTVTGSNDKGAASVTLNDYGHVTSSTTINFNGAGGQAASNVNGSTASFSDASTQKFKSIPGYGSGSKFKGAPKEFLPGLLDPKKRQDTLMAMSVKYGWNTGVEIRYQDVENTRASAENDGQRITFYRNAFYYPNYADLASVLFHELVHQEQWGRYGDLMRDWRYDNINNVLEYEAHYRTTSSQNPFSKGISKIYADATREHMDGYLRSMNNTNHMRATNLQFNCLTQACDGAEKK